VTGLGRWLSDRGQSRRFDQPADESRADTAKKHSRLAATAAGCVFCCCGSSGSGVGCVSAGCGRRRRRWLRNSTSAVSVQRVLTLVNNAQHSLEHAGDHLEGLYREPLRKRGRHSSGVYIYESVVNDLRHGNYMFKSEGIYLARAVESAREPRPGGSSCDSSGVYICNSIVNDLRHGNYICKSELIYLTYEHRIEIPVEFTYM
jgi:hypothetical protein